MTLAFSNKAVPTSTGKRRGSAVVVGAPLYSWSVTAAPGPAGVRVWAVLSRDGGHEGGARRRRALMLPILAQRQGVRSSRSRRAGGTGRERTSLYIGSAVTTTRACVPHTSPQWPAIWSRASRRRLPETDTDLPLERDRRPCSVPTE